MSQIIPMPAVNPRAFLVTVAGKPKLCRIFTDVEKAIAYQRSLNA